ncbi:hypothetical protein HNR22_000070 [Micromonospora jinlongensis]|uniref:Uncharacterized protein n=1 Tax=Micromonospora jinlongensis TaxID=1287877 RepID=A0A7Y9WXJ1_9ACTN|nr:hypothetical protein [Micromonospora jinlongensis]
MCVRLAENPALPAGLVRRLVPYRRGFGGGRAGAVGR